MSLSSVFYICLAVSLYPAICANRHRQELTEHFEHLNRIAGFACDTPQPRLVTVEELFSAEETHGKAYFPEVTVLHRCDRHCGSCNDATYTCGPTDSTNLTLIFKITFLEQIGIHDKGSWLMEHYHLANHTQCGCFKVKKQDPLYPPGTSNQDGYGVSVNDNPPIYTSPATGGFDPTESVLEVTTPDETNSDYPFVNGGEVSSTTPITDWSYQINDTNTFLDSEAWRSSFKST